jgi:hypothetical protein
MTETADSRWPWLRGVVALFVLGMTGVLALAVSSAPTLRTVPGLESLPTPLLVVVAALNSTILLTVFVLLGAATAPRVGLRSHVYRWATRRDPEWGSLRGSVPLAVGGGAALFVLTAVLDIAFAPFVNLDTGTTASVAALVDSIPIRLLYGGVTEELLLRWGVVAPVAWAVWRVRSRVTDSTPRPTDGTMWAAIAVSALLFGVGHLPALAASVGLTPALVVRTVLLNAVAGVGFGWLFWRRSLESAMVAHASFHVALVAVSAGLLLAG